MRDAETGNNYFGARYYTGSVSRFISPDWSAKVEPVPYSKLDDPQSLNLYSYVRNNPVTSVDPDGHDCSKSSSASEACKAENASEQASDLEDYIFGGGTGMRPGDPPPAQENSGSSDQYSHDIVLVGSKNKQDLAHAPVPEPDDGGFWTVDWMPYHLKNGELDGSLAAGCPECSTDPKIQVGLKESLGGGPYQDMGTKPGHGHDSFLTGGHGAAASTPDVNQHWYVNGSRVRIVMGVNPSTGKPILTWETHVSLQKSGPPVYSPVGSGDQ